MWSQDVGERTRAGGEKRLNFAVVGSREKPGGKTIVEVSVR